MAACASSASLDPQLETFVRAFQQAKADARRLITGSSQGALSKRPSPDQWSALECIAHLNLSSDAMLPGIRQAIEEAQRLAKAPASKYKMDLLGRLLAWSLEPPARLKFKTASFAEPVAQESAQETLAHFERRQDELIELVHSAAGLQIERCKMKSPFANMHYNTCSAFGILAAHNRRHLWQAGNVVEQAAKI